MVDAKRLAAVARTWFGNQEGAFTTAASDADDLPLGAAARAVIAADNATPAGNGLMAEVFARLYHLTGEDLWRVHAEAVIAACSGRTETLPACPTLLAAAEMLAAGGSVTVIGNPHDPATMALLATARATPDPTIAVLVCAETAEIPEGHPAHGKTTLHGAPATYVCRRQTCGLPISAAADLAAALQGR